MRARLIRITGVDLNLFEFDLDLTWACLFLNADGEVYGRYGGRDAKGADGRNTLEGLHYAMAAALDKHRKKIPGMRPPQEAPLYVEKLPSGRQAKGCIHCHQAKEIIRHEKMQGGTWSRDEVYTFPLPENIGIVVDLKRGNVVDKVLPGSLAAKVGVQSGDVLDRIEGKTIASFADIQYALHKAPLTGDLGISWAHEGKPMSATLHVTKGWKKTNITWRPSLLDMLPALTIYGSDLNVKERMALGLMEKSLAFRQGTPVHPQALAMGVRENDIVLGVDGLKLEMTVDQFLGYVRQNYLVGERLTLNLIRDGKRIDLPVKLK